MNRVGASAALCECFLVVSIGFVGCGGKTAVVNGRVKFKDGSDASALSGYSVTFESTEGKISGAGDVKPDGTFKISTYGAEDGAPPGKYRVAVTPSQSVDPDKPPPKSKVAAKYTDVSSSGIVVEVKPGRNEVTVEVEGTP